MIYCEIHNKGTKQAKSHWIIANDESDALSIASTQSGTPKSIDILTPVSNIPKLMTTGKRGILACQISMMNGLDAVMGRTPKPIVDPWYFMKEF